MLQSKPAETERGATTLFPLPLTPFEYYYYLDDSPAYPTAFPVELEFDGTLDREHFNPALERAVARHPMLAAVIDASGPRPVWVADKRKTPFVDWADESAPIAHPAGEFIDLHNESGLRTWVRTSPAGARVLFQVHHACCDGLSALQFVKDFLAAYKSAAGQDDEGSALRELDVELLRQRGRIAPPDVRGSLLTGLRDAGVTLLVWGGILFRTPEVLAAPEGRSGADATGPPREILSFERASLSPAETAELRTLAAALEMTPNDLLLRDFLAVLRGWNRRQAGSSCGRLRVNVPVNVRRRDELRMPAANRIGYGFVTAGRSAGDEPTQLLATVHKEMQHIKNWKLGLYFLGGLEMASHLPSVLRWALGRDKAFATAVLSNVGRFAPAASKGRREELWQCGDLRLKRIVGVPPIRKLTRAAIIVVEYGGQTSICLRCDPHYFGRAETRDLLDAYVEQVRDTLRHRR